MVSNLALGLLLNSSRSQSLSDLTGWQILVPHILDSIPPFWDFQNFSWCKLFTLLRTEWSFVIQAAYTQDLSRCGPSSVFLVGCLGFLIKSHLRLFCWWSTRTDIIVLPLEPDVCQRMVTLHNSVVDLSGTTDTSCLWRVPGTSLRS